jgi:flagellar biosynthesis protein FliQ
MDTAVDLVRQAVYLGLILSAPVLAVSIAVEMLMGILQAVTQIQEQTLSFVPRLFVTVLTVLAVLPWSIERLMEYATTLYQEMPSSF